MIEQVTLTRDELDQILGRIQNVTVCLVGDMCLDVYWKADMRLSELSRETPHHPLPVIEERFSPGGGANVASVIRKLGARVLPVSIIGNDWRGEELKRCFSARGIEPAYLSVSPDRITPAYCKPLRAGISDVVYEDPRIDFENRGPISGEQEDQLKSKLSAAAKESDIIAVADQFQFGVVTAAVRSELERLSGDGMRVIADSRDRATAFQGAIIKPNEVEAAAAVGFLPGDRPVTCELFAPVAEKLAAQTGEPVIVTLGSEGALWSENGATYHAPAKRVKPPIDIVGAGDAFLAGLSCALAAGTSGEKAVAFANLCSAVTIRKIGTTGDATPDEIIEAYMEAAQ